MSSLAENVFAARAENRPPILEKGIYDTWQSRMLLYVEGKEHGQMLLDSVLKGPFEYQVVTFLANEARKIPAEKRMQTFKDLTPKEKMRKFVTRVKQAKNLHEVSFDQLYAYLKQDEPDANEVHAMKARFPYPLALITNTYNPPPYYSCYKFQCNLPMLVADDPIASLNKAMMFLTTTISSRYPSTNNQLRTSSDPRTQANIQDGRVVVQNVQGRHAQGYTGNAGRGEEREILGIEIDVEQQDFLADGLEGFDSDYEELKLNATSILMTENVDAYDSEVDDAPTASEIFIEKLSPAGSINGDEVGPSYDSYILSEGQVKLLEYEKENQLVFTSREKDLDSQMRKLIVEYNHKEEAFNKEIIVIQQELSFTSGNNSFLKNNLEILK
ncbi:hypothetical protein Tco_1235643 [Tanacetum coccineum]